MCETFFKEVQKSFSAADQIFLYMAETKIIFRRFGHFQRLFGQIQSTWLRKSKPMAAKSLKRPNLFVRK